MDRELGHVFLCLLDDDIQKEMSIVGLKNSRGVRRAEGKVRVEVFSSHFPSNFTDPEAYVARRFSSNVM